MKQEYLKRKEDVLNLLMRPTIEAEYVAARSGNGVRFAGWLAFRRGKSAQVMNTAECGMRKRSREERRSRRQVEKEGTLDSSPPQAVFRKSPAQSLADAVRFVRDLAGSFFGSGDSAVWRIPESKYDAGAFTWVWLLSTLVGLLGVFAYAYPIGQHYFNVRYLVLIALSASLLGLLVLAASTLGLGFVYGRRGYTEKKVALHARLVLCFFWVPLTYVVFPLKLLYPALERHPLWVAIPLSLVAARMLGRAGSPLFSRRQFSVAYFSLAPPFFAAQALAPNLAKFLVELFRL